MEQEIKEISDYLNITCSNNPQEIQERISTIMVYMMRTGEMLAEKSQMKYRIPLFRSPKKTVFLQKYRMPCLKVSRKMKRSWLTGWIGLTPRVYTNLMLFVRF